MATLTSPSGSSSTGRDAPFRVATREVSLDFSTVGPDQSPNELGAMNDAAFRALLEKFAGIPPVKLIDGDPQLVVSAKRGRFILLPSNGKLLLRPANDPQQPYVKFIPNDVPGFLDETDQPGQAPAQTPVPPKKFSTLIGSAAAVVASDSAAISPRPAAPIYGAFPDKPGPSATTEASATTAASTKRAGAAPAKFRRRRVFSLAALLLVVAGGILWVFYAPAPAEPPPPTAPRSEFEPIAATDLLASLKQRFVGAYATSGEAGERLLEIRADGTFHYQEFGTGVALTANRSGTYLFAFRQATKTPLIRASSLGTIELRDEKSVVCEGAVFTRLP
jgi:hypothetical protein